MKKRVLATLVLCLLLSMALAGCGHEHSYIYVPNNDGTHRIVCEGERCEYSESGTCQYSSGYVCEICGHKHEHTYAYTMNGDGTHTITCSVEGCQYSAAENCTYSKDYICESCEFVHEHNLVVTSKTDGTHNKACAACGFSENVPCVLNEEFVCTECAWTHEHIWAYETVGDGTHNVTCTYECCPYTNNETCVDNDYRCDVCGYEFPKWTVKERDARTYYARKKLNVYAEPTTGAEVVKTLAVDDAIVCVGVVKKYKDQDVLFYQTEEGYFVEQDFKPKNQGVQNLCIAKSDQIYVFDTFYIYDEPRPDYDIPAFERVYNSIDEALIDLTGHDREWYKANWVYKVDMWGRDVYNEPFVQVAENQYVSYGTIYIDAKGKVSNYIYYKNDIDIRYGFDY